MSDQRDLAGRIALVTGASGGIGSAICRRLACDAAEIAVAYGNNAGPAEALAAEIVSGGGTARAFSSDMADPPAPERLIDDVEAALGPVDILVASHGLARQARYEDVDAAVFDHTVAVNLRAPFLLARRALPGMRERGFGRVLFISSVAAFRAHPPAGSVAPTRSRISQWQSCATAMSTVRYSALMEGCILAERYCSEERT
jgi:3-oxoacyl-[acyl-carrier protein] reductase